MIVMAGQKMCYFWHASKQPVVLTENYWMDFFILSLCSLGIDYVQPYNSTETF